MTDQRRGGGPPFDRAVAKRQGCRFFCTQTVVLTSVVRTGKLSGMALPSAKLLPVKPSSRKPRFDSPEQETFLNLWRTYDCLKALEEELFGHFQISAQQYNALRLLRSVCPAPMQTLALGKRLISRAPDTTRMLDRLEQRQLIVRERRSENRRVVEILITEPGLALLDEMAESVQEMHKQQLGHLSRTEQRDLIALLKRIREPHEDASCDWLDE